MILIIDMNWKKNSLAFDEFVTPIISIVKPLDDFSVKHYLEATSQDLSRSDKIILSGTPLKDTTTLTHPEKFIWLKEISKPILGICAGMQTIGLVYGCRLTRCLEIGMTRISTLKENPLFKKEFEAYSLHGYCIEEITDFDVLAKSVKCVQAIKHKEKQVFGVLFHPEVRNPDILRLFIEQTTFQ